MRNHQKTAVSAAGTRLCRMRTVRWVLPLVLTVFAAGLVAPGSGAVAGPVRAPAALPAPAVTSALDDQTASAAARASGRPVEVASRTTERERTLANPDGSWTYEQNVSPVRVRHGEGGWVPVQTALRPAADGWVRPVATAAGLSFSAGSAGAGDAGRLARIVRGSRSLSMSVPWALPVPVLSGSQATYRDVLPGVDLVVTAEAESFSEVLVVRSREAAADPGLSTLRFGIEVPGLTLRAGGGGFLAVDAAGTPVFASPTPSMWDSRSPERRVPMAITVESGHDSGWVTVRPDRSVLDDRATVYPVYIDPSVSGSRNEWAMISSGFPTQEYYKFSGDEGMGLCDVNVTSDCVRDQVKRLVWEFGIPAAVRGSHVLGAKFNAYETSAYDCTARAVELWRTNSISSGTNWSNHSGGWSQRLDSVSVARKSGCGSAPARVDFNAVTGAAQAAANGWSTLTLGLRAANEGSMVGGWKRFRNDAGLSITYNSVPKVPTGLSADGAGCGSGTARPVVSTITPTLRAVVGDADTDETNLQASFAWEKWTGSAWQALGSGKQTGLRPGATGQVKLAGLVDKGTYRWRVQTLDPWSFDGSSGTDASAWSGYCEFDVDSFGPKYAPGVSSPVYLADGQVHGSVGLSGVFTLAAGQKPDGSDKDADIAKYRWGWSDPPATEVAAPSLSASVNVTLTPPPLLDDPTAGGPTRLFVVAVDRANHSSPLATYEFVVGNATGPVGRWELSLPAGATSAPDTTDRGAAHPIALTGATTGVAGRMLGGPALAAPTAVRLNGTSSYGATTGPVLNTGNSFTVSAWVRVASTTATYQTAVNQAGTATGGFYLQKRADRWGFATFRSDVSGASVDAAVSSYTLVANAWTQLTGVYDAQGNQLRLYVNGVLAGTAVRTTPWNATGPLQIGRGVSQAVGPDYFNGDVAEVRVWDRVLSPGEIAPLGATRVGRWSLDGDGTDRTLYGRTATATGSPEWTEDAFQRLPGAVDLDGATQWLTTAGPAVRTDQSFTVAAWVNLRDATTATATALAQDGTNISGFFLGSRPDPTGPIWAFVLRSADAGAGVSSAAMASVPMPDTDVGDWVHLTGVYDATQRLVRLYVNGELRATVARTTPGWQAGGPFTIGRARFNPSGVPQSVDMFPGAVDDVQVFAGAVAPSEIPKLR